MALGMEVGLGSGHIVLDGDPAPLPKRGTAPNFPPMSIVAGCIKMLLGMEVGLGPGHIVLLPQKGHSPPMFGPCLLWPNGWMH